MTRERLAALIERVTEDGFVFVKAAAHAGVLGALAGEHEAWARRLVTHLHGTPRRFQAFDQFRTTSRRDGAAESELPAPLIEGEGDVAEIEIRLSIKGVGEIGRRFEAGFRGFRWDEIEALALWMPGGRNGQGLFKDDVGVGATHTE